MDDDAEIIAEFLVESYENLDQLDRDFVELEQQPNSRDLLSSIFRTIHTIKGTSGFLGLGRLEKLTHVGETLLSKLRDGQMTMNPRYGDALLRMTDTVRALLGAIEANGSDEDASIDVDSVRAEIEACLAGDAAPVAAAAPAAAEAAVNAESDSAVAETTVAVADAPEVEVPDSPAELAEEAPEIVAEAAAEVAAAAPAAADHGDQPAEQATAKTSVQDSTVRVDVTLLDQLVDLVGELVLTRNQILQRAQGNDDVELTRASQRLDLVASEMQESIMKTRMQPIGSVWSKMPRVVRDLAHQLGREVDLHMEGHETEMDRSVLEAVKDPLTHMVRNSMDHGIERPEDREKAGKPRTGRLSLRAFHESGQVIVEIADDGKGIDPEIIAKVALERGVITRDQLARMDTKEIVNLIFRAGFSTAEKVTNVSGRGVGMDVVRSNIERIGGTVDLTSEVGKGSTFRIRIPLTLAIIPALVVGDGGERYVIPQANLLELVRVEGADLKRQVEELAGAPVLRLRGRLLPLVSLSSALGGPNTFENAEALTVVVVQSDKLQFGLCVAEVHDTQEIVVKPVGRQLKGLPVYSGATIMGDGKIALILDIPGIAAEQGVGAVEDDADAKSVVEDDRTSLLVLEIADGHRAAVPLASVARLEEFDRSKIEKTGTKEVVQYRDGILPLLRLAPAIGLQDTSNHGDQISVVVHEIDNHSVGIVIDRVLDVVDAVVVPSEVGARAGVKGSAVVQERVTDLVDLEAIIGKSA